MGCWILNLLIVGPFLFSSLLTRGSGSADQPTVIVAVGAAGEEEFGKEFVKWAGLWEQASAKANAKYTAIGCGPTNKVSDLLSLKQVLEAEAKESSAELWLIFIGHGTFDGKEAKFNLRGPDISADELAAWLKPFHRPLAVINCASSSSPFINKLSAAGRLVVTATRSGYEQNYARFGQFIAEAIADPAADLDKDEQTSLLEAFVMASRRVKEFYDAEGRLATEHALLDDNGDGLGTPADFFRGVRAVKKPAEGATVDGLRAHQLHLVRSERELRMPPEVRLRRDELELALARLRDSKANLEEDEYYRRLENLMLELARFYSERGEPP